jgi:GH24 family phage-related lysozyme (muramidase)
VSLELLTSSKTNGTKWFGTAALARSRNVRGARLAITAPQNSLSLFLRLRSRAQHMGIGPILIFGLAAPQRDHGELCVEHPYVAGVTEHVCTIGYGHQIPDCPVLSKATGQKPTAEELAKAQISDLKCACEGRKFDCKGAEAEKQLRRDAGGAAAYVRKTVPVDLSQDQFDAFVDLTLHVGHIPSELLDATKKVLVH